MITTLQGSLTVPDLGLPPIDQIGFVVRDFDVARTAYSRLFGPCEERVVSVSAVCYRGRPADSRFRVAFFRSGPIELEVIAILEGESIHSEFLGAGREGLEHVRFPVLDVDATVARLQAVGYRPVYGARVPGLYDFEYLEHNEHPGTYIELVRFH